MWSWLKSPRSPPVQQQGSTAPASAEAPVAAAKCRVIIITGTSGSGRKHTAKQLSAELGIPYVLPYTTRSIRPHERNGEHYHFVSDSEFKAMEARQAFFQTVRLERGSYGITQEALTRALEQHPAVIVVVNREAAHAFRQAYGDSAVRIFLYVTKEDIRVRLEREKAPPEVMEEYLRNYTDQVIHKKESELLFQNLDPSATVAKIKAFLKDRL